MRDTRQGEVVDVIQSIAEQSLTSPTMGDGLWETPDPLDELIEAEAFLIELTGRNLHGFRVRH